MANIKRRRLPVGVQSFKKIREEGYVYVDKTDIVWELANYGDQYNYLNRPRRFGKSVLVDTLEAYFRGRKELFEGLKIMDMEDDWKQYPVIRLDMSRGGASAEGIRSYLNLCFKSYEQKYAITPDPTAQLADRFDAIITTAYRQTGMQVVVLIDEEINLLSYLLALLAKKSQLGYRIRLLLQSFLGTSRKNMCIDVTEEIEYKATMVVQSILIVIQSCCHLGKIEADDEICIMLWCRILPDVKLAKDFLKLVFFVDVIVILKHGEGECLAETARANEEEIHVRFFYFLYEWGLVNIVTISFHYILKVLHSVRDALAIDSLLSFYFCHNRNQLFVFMPQS